MEEQYEQSKLDFVAGKEDCVPVENDPIHVASWRAFTIQNTHTAVESMTEFLFQVALNLCRIAVIVNALKEIETTVPTHRVGELHFVTSFCIGRFGGCNETIGTRRRRRRGAGDRAPTYPAIHDDCTFFDP